jgi:hypothetical protein
MGDTKVVIRIPVAENILTDVLPFIIRGRLLNDREYSEANGVYQGSIQLLQVRISDSPNSYSFTVGNNIFITGRDKGDFSTLIHELMHVWQFQTKGTRYLPDSIANQITKGRSVTTGAYYYAKPPVRLLSFYAAEQQAMIVQDYYDGMKVDPKNFEEQNSDYKARIAEVRMGRPIGYIGRTRESIYGGANLNSNWQDLPNGVGGRPSPQAVPLIRIEF